MKTIREIAEICGVSEQAVRSGATAPYGNRTKNIDRRSRRIT